MNNRRQNSFKPIKLPVWEPLAVRINNMLMNKSQSFTFSLDEQLSYRLQLLPADIVQPHIYPVSLTLGIGDASAGLWLSDWPLLDNIREYIPEGMLSRLPENLGIALTENALEPLVSMIERSLVNKIKVQSLSAQQNSPDYKVSVGFQLVEAHRDKPENESTRIINGLLMLEEHLYPLLQERLSFWPSDLNEDWEHLESTLYLEIGQTALTIPEINALNTSDVILLEAGSYQENIINLRLKNHLYCEAQLAESENYKTLTILKDWHVMADNETKSSIDQINKLPVKLSFDIGQKTISFNEVKQLRPGYIIDLPGNLPEVIQIHAQNKQIGTGELVEISGRIGVRIISLFGSRNKNG